MHRDPKELFEHFLERLKSVEKKADLLNLKSQYLGKTGHLSEVLKSLKLANELKPVDKLTFVNGFELISFVQIFIDAPAKS